MRLTAALLAPFFLGACSQLADHGPISAGTLAQMEQQVLTKDQFCDRMERPSPPPAEAVTLPLRMVAGVPVLKALINGHGEEAMMLDTGASRSMIQANTAVKKRVPVLPAEDATVELQGVVGKEQSRIGLLDPLVLGNWALNGYPCLVRTYENRLHGMRGADSFPESLLGFDVAANRCSYLTVDYRGEQVTFGFRTAYEPILRHRAGSAPFRMDRGVPFITLQSGKEKWEAIVDTGSFNGLEISEEVAKRLGVQDQGEVVRGLYLMAVGGTVNSAQVNLRKVKLPAVAFLGETYRDAEVDIAPGMPRVGSYFLKDYRVTFDFKQKKLWLEW